MRFFIFLMAIACQKFAYGIFVAGENSSRNGSAGCVREAQTLEQAVTNLGGTQFIMRQLQILEQHQAGSSISLGVPSSVRAGDIFIFRLRRGDTNTAEVYSVNMRAFALAEMHELPEEFDSDDPFVRLHQTMGEFDCGDAHFFRLCHQWLDDHGGELVATLTAHLTEV